MGKLTALLALSASIGCIAGVSDEYVEQEVQGCSCGAQIVKETRSTDEWLRLSEYVRAGANRVGVAYEIVGEAGKANCLVKSIYMFTETADGYSEIRYRDEDCNYTVDAFIMLSPGQETVMPRELFGNAYDNGILEMEADFDANFGIEQKIEEWRARIE